MQPLSDRTAGFTDSVIRRMTRISNQYGAVNLSQGFPDFDPPKAILDRLAEVAHEDYHQYSITWGAQNFREALAAKQTRYMGRTIDPNSEIVVTCGSTEAMMTAMMTVTNPGDKVVIFSPFYENYGADTILTGAEPIYVPLTPPEFTFDPEVLENVFRQHPKALILCNPSNPCGKVFTREELEQTLTEKRDAEHFLRVLAPKYKSVFVVDLKTDRMRGVIVPDYFQKILDTSGGSFLAVLQQYRDTQVQPAYRESLADLLDYNYIRSKVLTGDIVEHTYKKTDDTTFRVKVTPYSRSGSHIDETLWIFSDEGASLTPPQTK